jgi:FdhD protein
MQPVDLPIQYYKYSRDGWQSAQTRVIAEAAVSLTVNSEIWLSFLCTPPRLEALVVGFLFNEQIIQTGSEIAAMHICKAEDNVDVWLTKPVQKPAQWLRTSGCGGGYTQNQTQSPIRAAGNFQPVSPEALLDGMEQLLKAQDIYREARGIHCSALSDGQRILYQVEDIGRHNTLDKLAGRLLLEPVENSPKIILTTGRISSEMMSKTIRMGAEVVVSRTSPTTHSIQLAQAAGITLVGYARGTQFFVYAHPERLMPSQ